MPTILRVGPHRFFFYSNEGHEPVHVHVETAERTAKCWLNPIEIAYAKGYNSKELNQLSNVVEENLSLFSDKWNEYFG